MLPVGGIGLAGIGGTRRLGIATRPFGEVSQGRGLVIGRGRGGGVRIYTPARSVALLAIWLPPGLVAPMALFLPPQTAPGCAGAEKSAKPPAPQGLAELFRACPVGLPEVFETAIHLFQWFACVAFLRLIQGM